MKINKLLCLAASALALTACGGNQSSSATSQATTSTTSQASSQATSEVTSTTSPEVTRTNFEFVLPTNYQFSYSWETTTATHYQVTKIGERYLSYDGLFYNYFVKLANGSYSHYYNPGEGWSHESDMTEASFKRLLLMGLYPTSDGSYVKTESTTRTIKDVDYNVDKYQDSKAGITIEYHESSELKLILARSDDDGKVSYMLDVDASVTKFPVEVPEEN